MEYYVARKFEGKLPPRAARFMGFDYYEGVFEDPFFGKIENGTFKGYLPTMRSVRTVRYRVCAKVLT